MISPLNVLVTSSIAVGLCFLSALFAIIAMATRGWVTVEYKKAQYTVGLQMVGQCA